HTRSKRDWSSDVCSSDLESTFVLPPDDRSHTARVRIFTRQNEIPFAGHPNVGTAFVLALVAERSGRTLGSTVVFEEAAGRVPVRSEERRVGKEGGGRWRR